MPARHALHDTQPSTASPNIQSPPASPRLKHATPSPSLSDLSSPGTTPRNPDLSDANDNDENLNLQATRKRKLDEISAADKDPRRISPPWKNPAANGPSSVIVDGRRKSSRAATQAVSASPSDSKRVRVAQPNGARTKANGTSHRATNGHADGDASRRSSRLSTSSLPKSHEPPAQKVRISTSKRPRYSLPFAQPARPPRVSVDSKPIPAPQPTPPRHNPRPRRSAVHYEDAEIVSSSPLTRIRLRVDEPVLLRHHPGHFPKARTHASFEEWLASDNPLEEEDPSLYSEASIQRDARIRLQIVKAMEPGGPLSDARRMRADMLTPTNINPRYGSWDFVVGHALNFSKLVGAESRRHRNMATRLARSAGQSILTDAKWNFLHTQSEEAIHEKELAINKKRFKQLMKDLEQKWGMAKREVEAIKLAQWEKEQELIGTKAMDEMLVQSKRTLERQFHDSSELQSEDTSRAQSILVDEDLYEGVMIDAADDETMDEETGDSNPATPASDEVDDSDDDHNLTDSDDDASEKGADEDMNLTQEELLAKYSQALEADLSESEESESESEDENEGVANAELEQDPLPNGILPEETPGPTSDATPDPDQVAVDDVDRTLLDDSDASSTDMSDDMGDSDASADDADESGSDDESGDQGLSSLLGLYLSKQEILQLQQAEAAKSNTEIAEVGPQEDPKDAIVSDAMSVEESADAVDKRPPRLNFVELPSDGPTEDENARSTSREDDAVSTPTTSIIPSTPRPYRTEVSPLLRGTLREYQHDGVDWLAKLYSGGRNGILADEMGLGKTIQTIALLAHLATHHEVWGPHLVVVPTSVILNWEMEFKKWCPAFKILTYYGNIEERKAKRRGWTNDDKWNVCITSYQLILQDAQAFKKRAWHYLVLDEAHNIKNFQTQRWQTLLTFRTHSRLLLTGTPLQNNLQELWSLLYFLMPAGTDGAGGFADLEKFLNSMKRPADQILDQGLQQLDPEAQARVNKLHEILRPFLLRRLKSEVEKQMPAKYEHVVYCRLSKRQRQLYDEFMGRADTRRTLASGNYMSIINCLMSLRKVCNHPDLFETRQIVTSLAMPRSAVASYEIKELLVRRRLLSEESIDLDYCGLIPVANEPERNLVVRRLRVLEASRQLEKLASRESEKVEAAAEPRLGEADSVLSRMVQEARKNAIADLRNRAEHMKRAAQRHQIYGKKLRDDLALPNRFDPPLPSKKRPLYSHGDWFLDRSTTVAKMLPMANSMTEDMDALIMKFGCVTPAVVAEDVVPLTLTKTGVEVVGRAMSLLPKKDPYHEARIRLSIAFPDKRLLQYDCGKLQRLERLLRELQAGGHRCLIFTQMTKVLDILEQFLNIHGHRYLRLDGATKIEQRQILTDRFNNDSRILAFILSSRSGGLGINLTGADTVIFYDLDWNPAMDKQCQDRCHRIGQTRDVHIYRFVSEYTIEANILRKSNQKRLLDDVIIQRGEFTTDIFNRVTYRDALDAVLDVAGAPDEDGAAAAVDRVLGDIAGLPQALEAVEDREDAAAAKAAQKEMVIADDLDFRAADPPAGGAAGEVQAVAGAAGAGAGADASNPAAAMDAALAAEEGAGDVPHVDDYLVRFLMREMEGVVVRAPAKGRGRMKKKADWKKGK